MAHGASRKGEEVGISVEGRAPLCRYLPRAVRAHDVSVCGRLVFRYWAIMDLPCRVLRLPTLVENFLVLSAGINLILLWNGAVLIFFTAYSLFFF